MAILDTKSVPEVTPLRRFDYTLLGLLALLFLTLLSRYIDPATLRDLTPWPDAVEYVFSAHNLSENGRFAIFINGVELPSRYSLGYPLLLAPFYKLTGADYSGAIYLTLLLDLAQVGLVYWLGRRIFGSWAGLLAAAFVTGSIGDVFMGKQLMSDLPNSVLLLAALLPLTYLSSTSLNQRLTFSRKLNSPPHPITLSLISGLLFGYACLIRQTDLLFLPFFLLFLITANIRPQSNLKPHLSSFILHPSSFILGWLAFQLPVLIFNRLTFGGFTRNGYNFWLPAWYDNLSKTFNFDYAFGSDGRTDDYLQILVGLPGGTFKGEKLALYSPVVAALALFCLIMLVWRFFKPGGWRLLSVRFGLLAFSLIATTYVLYSFYWYKADIRFVHFWLPLVAILAGGTVEAAFRRLPTIRRKRQRLAISLSCYALLTIFTVFLLLNALGEGGRLNGQYQAVQYKYIQLINEVTPSNAVIVTDDIQPVFFSAYQQYTGQRRMLSLAQTRHTMPVTFRFPTIREQSGLVGELLDADYPVYYLYLSDAAGQFERMAQTAAYQLEEVRRLAYYPSGELILARITRR
jgi:4-amino-4-deoxy-L-arabinose transferase-like glycosyltransferase